MAEPVDGARGHRREPRDRRDVRDEPDLRHPVGPHAGIVEKATLVDLGCTAGEIVLVAILLGMVGTTSRRLIINLLLVVGVALWFLRLTNNPLV